MSALRVCIGGEIVLLDPHTREPHRPDQLPVRGSGPVEIVTPATTAPRPRPAPRLSAEEIHERHVKGGKAVAAIHKARREGRTHA